MDEEKEATRRQSSAQSMTELILASQKDRMASLKGGTAPQLAVFQAQTEQNT